MERHQSKGSGGWVGYCTAKSNPPTHTALPDSKEEGPPRRINDQRNPREEEEGMGFMNSPSTFFPRFSHRAEKNVGKGGRGYGGQRGLFDRAPKKMVGITKLTVEDLEEVCVVHLDGDVCRSRRRVALANVAGAVLEVHVVLPVLCKKHENWI